MIWQLTAGYTLLASQLLPFVTAVNTCNTKYASTSTSSVPTFFTTKTTKITETETVYTSTTSTYTYAVTYVVVSGQHTVTVPTGPSFTPIVSAPSGQPNRRRDIVRPNKRATTSVVPASYTKPRPKSSSSSHRSKSKFPSQVNCTSTVTDVHNATTTYTLSTGEFTYPTYTSTKHVATSTAYAACQNNNIITEFDGNIINVVYGSSVSVCGHSGAPEHCTNARTCCEGAQAAGYGGFSFYNESYTQCFWLKPGFYFGHGDPGESPTPLYLGNGPSGSGEYAGASF